MRIQLDLDDAGIELVDELKHLTGSRTYKDLFNNAIALLDWAVRQRTEGRRITSVGARGEESRELVMPALQQRAAFAAREMVAR
jgi:hypothetical protein